MRTVSRQFSRNTRNILRAAVAALLAGGAAVAQADGSIGINPYAEGFGFDRPNEASWGSWSRCAPGTLFAEWDNFDDASH
ncbi:MAG: hypothetical protein EHM62_08795, partial [Methylococcus sp.]